MKVFTDSRYAKSTLILPVVGQVTLDDKAGLEVSEEQGKQLIEATKGSLEFSAEVVDRVKQVQEKKKAAEQDKVKAPKKSKKEIEDEEAAADNEAIKEAIGDADLDGLLQLLPLIPDLSENDVKDMGLEQLRAFLLSKVK